MEKLPQSVAQVMAQELSLPEGITVPRSSDSVNDVILTPEEQETALMSAKWAKYDRVKKEQAEQFRTDLKRNLTRPWNWVEMMQFVRHRAENDFKMNLQIDGTNEKLFEALCKYFTSDKDFETMGEDWRLDKGLMLMGGVGTGKTTLIRLFSRNQRSCYDIIGTRTAVECYERDGDKAIQNFSETRTEFGRDPRYFYQYEISTCFDDLGTEKIPVAYYGNKTNVMSDILLNRYDSGKPTHVTTNLLPSEIEAMYGTRVKSRTREMFNLIKVEGDDRRK